MTMLTKASIDKLTSLLALPATGHEQDWDVELADANRISDFLETYYDSSMTSNDKFALMALLLASVDLHIQTEEQVPDEWPRITAILIEELEIHQESLRYWSCEQEDDPEGWFFLTPHVRALVRS